MKQKKIFSRISVFAALILFSLATSGETMTVDKSKWPQKILIGGSVLGGPDYIIMNGIANILSQKLGLDVTVQATAGTVGNFTMVQNGKCHIAVTSSEILVEGVKGTGWAKGKKQGDVRLLMVMYPKILHFWTPVKTGIKDIMDLNGKKVNLSKAGSGADLMARRVFQLFKIVPAKITSVSHGDANNMIRDGLIDASCTLGFAPNSNVSELALTDAIRVVGFTEEQRKKMLAAEDHLAPVTIPKGTYKGADYDVLSVSDNGILIVNKNTPDDFAYMVTKTIVENLKMLEAVHNEAHTIKPESISSARGTLAPGAYEYYKEKGYAVPTASVP